MTLYELRRLAAAQAGLPQGLADRLQGQTGKELAADAADLVAALPPPPSAPPQTHEDLLRRVLAANRSKHADLVERMHPDLVNGDNT